MQEYWDRINRVWAHLRNTEMSQYWKTNSYEILWLLACADMGEKDPRVISYGKMLI